MGRAVRAIIVAIAHFFERNRRRVKNLVRLINSSRQLLGLPL
jgi:hypothetical protein